MRAPLAHTVEYGYAEVSEGTPYNRKHNKDFYALVSMCVHANTVGFYLTEVDSGDVPTSFDTEEAELATCTYECNREEGCITS